MGKKKENCLKVVDGNTNIDLKAKNLVISKKYSWCFTSFEIEKPKFDNEKMKYLCFSPEVCPTTGKPHWQGYFYLYNQMTMSAIKKKINGSWKLIPCDGSPQQNIIYCGAEDYVKDGKQKLKNPLFEEFGVRPEMGKRTDLVELKENLVSGKCSIDNILIENPVAYHQYGRTLEKIDSLINSKKFRMLENMPDVVWYYGETGAGKSHKLFEGYNPETHYLLNVKDSGFWEGYKLQKIILINEFRGEMKFNDLLQLCDKWPYTVKSKGKACMPCMAETVIISSCKRPEDIYNHSLDDKDNIEQFLRRCKIVELKKGNF